MRRVVRRVRMHAEHPPPGGGKLSLASLAVLALAPHTAVGADGGAPAVLAFAPHSVVLADGGAPAVLALGECSEYDIKRR